MTKDVILVSEQEPSYILVPSPTTTADLVTHTDFVVYIPLATRETYGSIKIGDGLLINDGVLSLDADEIPILSISKNGERLVPDKNKNVNILLSKFDVGLGSVDNTADEDKPISISQQIALDSKLNKNLGSENYNKILYVNPAGDVDLRNSTIDIDHEMSDVSENAVANKVIKKYVDEKGGKIDSISVNGEVQDIQDKNVNIDLNNYARKDESQTFTGSQTIVGNLTIEGNITQNGEQYITEAEKVVTEDDYILLRKGATGGLGSGYSGFEVENYNGNGDNARLVVDTNGIARVGDVGDEQPLLTREETADLTNGEVLVWNSTTNRAEGSSEYVKNTDYATNSNVGLVKGNPSLGIYVDSKSGAVTILSADTTLIDSKADNYRPITPKYLDYAVKVGVTTNTIELTEEEKTNAQNWLGVSAKLEELEFPMVTRLI